MRDPFEAVPLYKPDRDRVRAVVRALECPHCDLGTVTITTGDGSHGTLEPAPCEVCNGAGFRVDDPAEAVEILRAAYLVGDEDFPAPNRRFACRGCAGLGYRPSLDGWGKVDVQSPYIRPREPCETCGGYATSPLPREVYDLALFASHLPLVLTMEEAVRASPAPSGISPVVRWVYLPPTVHARFAKARPQPHPMHAMGLLASWSATGPRLVHWTDHTFSLRV
jgi:hypothetical protein